MVSRSASGFPAGEPGLFQPLGARLGGLAEERLELSNHVVQAA
jgi:hypothetical protein